jgi:hypothetical protein
MANLSPREIALKNQLYNQYKAKKKDFIKDYGADAEQVMLGTAINRAKKMAMKEQKQRIKELVKQMLGTPPAPKEENPTDTITVDVPLMIRLLEYAREDATTDMDLHKVTENLIQLSKEGRILDMTDYNSIIEPDTEA